MGDQGSMMMRIATGWKQRPVDDFIEASKEGSERGSDFMYSG